MNYLFALLAESASDKTSIFAPSSPPAESIRDLSILVVVIALGIFLVVEGVLLYCIVQFRRRGNETIAAEPAQVYGSKPIEVAWTVAPALIVFTLVLVTTRTLWEVDVPPPAPVLDDNTLFVTVVGRQWWWEYRYQRYNGQPIDFVTANELHIPASDAATSRRVYLTLKSADVCHSFWVPRLAGKTDLIPGRENSMWFQTDKAGLFVGQCAEYCGMQHANMLLRVFVDEPAAFERWLLAQKQPAVNEPAVDSGRAAFLGQSCVNCHRIRGTAAVGSYAPDLTHLMSRTTLAAGMIENNAANLRRWIADPQNIKQGCLMPAFGLSDRDRDSIVDYLLTLR
jgi:cytochrome c oxidase subunit II